MASAMRRLTLRIITKTLFDLDDGDTTEQLGKALTAVVERTPRFGQRRPAGLGVVVCARQAK